MVSLRAELQNTMVAWSNLVKLLEIINMVLSLESKFKHI